GVWWRSDPRSPAVSRCRGGGVRSPLPTTVGARFGLGAAGVADNALAGREPAHPFTPVFPSRTPPRDPRCCPWALELRPVHQPTPLAPIRCPGAGPRLLTRLPRRDRVAGHASALLRRAQAALPRLDRVR